MKAQILGAGLSGCLAGIVLPDSTIYEGRDEAKFKESPEHKAVLRFRTDNISKLTGIPFKQVQVRKSIWSQGKEYRIPDIRLTNMYSRKVSNKYTNRSIVNLDTVTRYIPPEDLHLQLLSRLGNRVIYSSYVKSISRDNITFSDAGVAYASNRTGPIVSTLAMPLIARIVGEECPVSMTSSKKIVVIRYRVHNSNLNLSMYYPDALTPVYRISIVKDLMSVEMIEDLMTGAVCDTEELIQESLGIEQDDLEFLDEGSQIGKISYDLDDRTRKNWIFKLTLNHMIYSLGRFALWKNILQDDVYEDVLRIREFIQSGTHYDFFKDSASA